MSSLHTITPINEDNKVEDDAVIGTDSVIVNTNSGMRPMSGRVGLGLGKKRGGESSEKVCI